MKKNVVFLVLIFLSLGLLSSCSTDGSKNLSLPQAPHKVASIPPSNIKGCKDVKQVGLIIIASVIDGLSTKNYELYTRDFTKEAKKSFTQTIFEEASDAVKENLGKFLSDTYLGYYDKGGFSILLWKAKYSKSTDDILLELYLKKCDNTYKVAAFMPN